jgi:hypothetical protein
MVQKDRRQRANAKTRPCIRQERKDGPPEASKRRIADSATFPLLPFAFFRVSTYN